MKYITDKHKTNGICSILPQSKKERKILFALYESLKEISPSVCRLKFEDVTWTGIVLYKDQR